jgi:hypothetical protein
VYPDCYQPIKITSHDDRPRPPSALPDPNKVLRLRLMCASDIEGNTQLT